MNQFIYKELNQKVVKLKTTLSAFQQIDREQREIRLELRKTTSHWFMISEKFVKYFNFVFLSISILSKTIVRISANECSGHYLGWNNTWVWRNPSFIYTIFNFPAFRLIQQPFSSRRCWMKNLRNRSTFYTCQTWENHILQVKIY